MMASQHLKEDKNPTAGHKAAEVCLEAELDRLKHLSGLGFDLKIVWEPSPEKALSGEVKGDIIHIYEMVEGKAVEVLRHEFLDFCISQAIEPYRMVTNKLIKLINEDMYKEKERIVEGLIRLLFERNIQF